MSSPATVVAALSTTPVKSLRVQARREALLERDGLRGDRRFYLVDERGWMVNGKHIGALNQVVAGVDEAAQRLTLAFPAGEILVGAIELGPSVQTRFYSRARTARTLLGDFSAALSEHAGQPLRIVESADGSSAIDRGEDGAVTIISQGSLESLARAAREPEIDVRRFRMSIELAGAAPHEEDGWIGRDLAVGGALVRLHGHVGRCIVTSRHPHSGELDLATLDLLREYRAGAETTEPLAFGVYGAVLREGLVRVGDAVQLV
jgi:MOSC domain-containing protein